MISSILLPSLPPACDPLLSAPSDQSLSLITRPEVLTPTQQDVSGFDSSPGCSLGHLVSSQGGKSQGCPLGLHLTYTRTPRSPLPVPSSSCPSTVWAEVAPPGMTPKEGKEGSPRIWSRCPRRLLCFTFNRTPVITKPQRENGAHLALIPHHLLE